MPEHASDRPIFIVGCPRSGTTLLQLMLHAHPRIAIPPETRILVHAYNRRLRFGDLSERRNREALAEWIASRPRLQFGDLGIDAATFVERAGDGPGTLGSVLEIVYRMYAERHGKPRWGDKRPPYIRHIDAIVRMFPDAQFIHLIRDPRDCVASLKEMPWFRGTTAEAAHRWAEAIDLGRRAARRLPAGGYIEIQYERLTADPRGTLTELCAFLGEEFDEAMLEPSQVADVVPSHKHWHRNVRREVMTGRAGSWTRRLEPWEAGLCEAVLGERMAAYGYEPTGAPRPERAVRREYRKVAARARRRLRYDAIRDRLIRLREPNPVASQLDVTTPNRAPELIRGK
ncbi:MAG: sulfotransferase [Actinomycetes bacterium]